MENLLKIQNLQKINLIKNDEVHHYLKKINQISQNTLFP